MRTHAPRFDGLVRNLVVLSGKDPAPFIARSSDKEIEISTAFRTRCYPLQAWTSKFTRDLANGVFDEGGSRNPLTLSDVISQGTR